LKILRKETTKEVDAIVNFLYENPSESVICPLGVACDVLVRSNGRINIKVSRPDVYELTKSNDLNIYVYLAISILALISLITSYFIF
jgi:hypothetical protein